jgi:hypothetical protein
MKPPFDVVRMAMWLLAVLVITPVVLALLVVLRCTINYIPACDNRPWVPMFRDWLGETLPILVAIIMAGRFPPSPPPPGPPTAAPGRGPPTDSGAGDAPRGGFLAALVKG